MSMGTSILSLLGSRDPREKLLRVAGDQQPATVTPDVTEAQYPAAADPEGGIYATQAARDAAAQPPAQPVEKPQPEAYQSPAELLGMYKELMEYNQKAQNVDRGIALLGSAFAHPENRSNIMQAFSPSSNAADLSSMDPIAIQKSIMELQSAETTRTQRAAMLAQLPMIAKKYGIDEATAQLLYQNEQLDDFISEREKATFTRDNEKPTTATNQGQTIGFDPRTGKELYRIGVPDKPKLQFQKVGDDLHIIDEDGKTVRTVTDSDPEYQTITDTDGTTMIVDKKNPGKVLSRIGTPKDMTATDDTKEYDRYAADTTATGGKPITFQEWQLQKQKASATNVTVNNGGEKKFNEKMGEEQAKRYVGYQQAADSARKSKEQYALAEKALESGLETGTGADMMLAARKAGQFLGVDVDEGKIAAAETLKAASNQMAMLKRNPESGMGLPGSVSDRDLQFLKDADFNLGTSNEGNKTLIKVARKMAERQEQVAMMAAEYVEKNGSLDTGWEKQLQKFANDNPLFDDLKIGSEKTPEQIKAEEDAIIEGYVNGQ